MTTEIFYYFMFWICILGLCLGSFYNVVILRSLSGESIVFPPSKCPKCGNKLLFWHNIPVLSYIILKGKCYFCKEKISIQYPIIEILTMFLFGFTFYKYGISLDTPFILLWLSCLLIMTVTDLKEKIADCNLAIIMAVFGVIYNFLNTGTDGLVQSFLGLIAGAAIIEIIARIGYIFVKSRAMGEADTYVAGALGAIFGLKIIPFVLLYAFIASMIFIVPMFLWFRFKSKDFQTCIFSFLFIISILSYKLYNQNWYTLCLLLIFGICLSFSILKSINKEENRNYLPYIPALALGTVYQIFFISIS